MRTILDPVDPELLRPSFNFLQYAESAEYAADADGEHRRVCNWVTDLQVTRDSWRFSWIKCNR